jgi:hypothetical protein
VSVPRVAAPTLALLLLSACASGQPRAPSIDASPPAESSGGAAIVDDRGARSTTPETVARGGTTVALVDAGEAPRRELRYDFAGARRDVPVGGVLTTTYGVGGTDRGGDPLPSRPPTTLAASTEMTVLDVDDEGTATVAFAFADGAVTDTGGASTRELEQLQALVEALPRVRSTYEVDDRGFTTLVDVAAPADRVTADGSAAGGFDAVTVAQRLPAFVQPLPAEPVGVGAVWSVVGSTHLGTLPVTYAMTVELLDLDGDLLELLFTVDDATRADVMSAASGSPVDAVTGLALTGGGNVTTRLDQALPLAAATGMTAEVALDPERSTTLQRTIVSDASLETTG